MVDSTFFRRSGPFSLAELAVITGGHLRNENDGARLIKDVATLGNANADDITFFHNPQFYIEALKATNAGAVIIAPQYGDKVPAEVGALLVDEPYLAFSRVARAFYPEEKVTGFIHPTASVHPSAQLAADCSVGPYAVIEEGAIIGSQTKIHPHAVIGSHVCMGESCSIGAHVVLSHCKLGDRVSIDPGACIGQPGFGFHSDYVKGHTRVPQLGRVLIEDGVHIGANVTIDRGGLEDTVIASGTMIDNLVQIAHGVRLGRNNVIVAQVGIAGSTHVDDYVTLAGQVGVSGHLKIGKGAVVAAQSGVMRDVADGEVVAGSPAVPITQWRRQCVVLAKMINKKDSDHE